MSAAKATKDWQQEDYQRTWKCFSLKASHIEDASCVLMSSLSTTFDPWSIAAITGKAKHTGKKPHTINPCSNILPSSSKICKSVLRLTAGASNFSPSNA